MKRLVLVGGGHAHLSVLEALARERPCDVQTVLVTPSRFQVYSGMMPGWMAGHYTRMQCQIDLHPLWVRAQGTRADQGWLALERHLLDPAQHLFDGAHLLATGPAAASRQSCASCRPNAATTRELLPA